MEALVFLMDLRRPCCYKETKSPNQGRGEGRRPMEKVKIGYIGTDGRSFLAALETSRATSELYPGDYQGLVVRGTPAMPPSARKMNWPVGFIPVSDNSLEAYAEALLSAFSQGLLDLALIMPEALIFDGLVARLEAA